MFVHSFRQSGIFEGTPEENIKEDPFKYQEYRKIIKGPFPLDFYSKSNYAYDTINNHKETC
jgi:hypothetical protein